MNLRTAMIVALSALGGIASAAAPPGRVNCESDVARRLVACLHTCTGSTNDASARVCRKRCLEKNDELKAYCASRTPRLIIF